MKLEKMIKINARKYCPGAITNQSAPVEMIQKS